MHFLLAEALSKEIVNTLLNKLNSLIVSNILCLILYPECDWDESERESEREKREREREHIRCRQWRKVGGLYSRGWRGSRCAGSRWRASERLDWTQGAVGAVLRACDCQSARLKAGYRWPNGYTVNRGSAVPRFKPWFRGSTVQTVTVVQRFTFNLIINLKIIFIECIIYNIECIKI